MAVLTVYLDHLQPVLFLLPSRKAKEEDNLFFLRFRQEGKAVVKGELSLDNLRSPRRIEGGIFCAFQNMPLLTPFFFFSLSRNFLQGGTAKKS